MTLRLRLFLLVAGLVALLVAAQALLVRSLADRLDRDVRSVAVSVGEEILSGFAFKTEQAGSGELETRVVVLHQDEAAAGGAAVDADLPAKQLSSHAPESGHWVERRTITRRLPKDEAQAPGLEEQILIESFSSASAPGDTTAAAGIRRPQLVPDADGALFVRSPSWERRIALPKSPLASTLDRFRSELTLGSFALLAVGLLAAAFVAHRTTRPIGQLARAAERVGKGELGLEVEVERRDEIGAALGAFNSMSVRLAELDRENRRLAESEHLSELGEVARGLAHTLRNPLNALGLAVETLAEVPGHDAAGRERAAELADRCRRQIRRIDGSLRSFLALASASAARPEGVELGALARETALEALQDSAGRVRIDVEAPEHVELRAVAAEVKAIVQALVVNACEASPDGGRVVVRVAGSAERARVEVDDDGPGVAPEVAGRLFAPHVTTKPHGSGMGLYLARRLATTRYGGEVRIVARAPEGAPGTRATAELSPRSEGREAAS